jgi:hypothetical protein
MPMKTAPTNAKAQKRNGRSIRKIIAAFSPDTLPGRSFAEDQTSQNPRFAERSRVCRGCGDMTACSSWSTGQPLDSDASGIRPLNPVPLPKGGLVGRRPAAPIVRPRRDRAAPKPSHEAPDRRRDKDARPARHSSVKSSSSEHVGKRSTQMLDV